MIGEMRMRLSIAVVVLLVALPVAVLAVTAAAQEGHPLTGTWYGEWGPEGARNQVTIILRFDGADVAGIMDPGPNSAVVEAILDSTNWTVQIEAAGVDASGNRVTHRAEGAIEDAGSRNRTISGTWRTGDSSSDFSIRRED